MCFSLEWLRDALILLVVVCLIVASVRLIVPWITGKFNLTIPPQIVTLLGYILWAVILIFVIIVFFNLLACLLGIGGAPLLHLPRP